MSKSKAVKPAVIYVPVVSAELLDRVEKLVTDARALIDRMDDATRDLDASVSVLNGSNEPEGWKRIYVQAGFEITPEPDFSAARRVLVGER